MVTANTVTITGSKPTAHKAKLSTAARSSSSRVGSSSSSRSLPKKASHPLLRDSYRYIADEMDQQRQDYGSNRHDTDDDEESMGGGREGSRADHDDYDEERDEFPIESYLGGGNSIVPVLPNHTLLPYPKSNGSAATNAPGLGGDLHNLMIESQNSWDVLNQNDSFGFDFNKGEMSLSFESHDYNVLDSTAVTESMDGDTHQMIDWATVAPQMDVHGNLIPPTSTTNASGRVTESRNDVHSYHHDHHHHLGGGGGGGMRDGTPLDDPFAYAFGGPNSRKATTNSSNPRKGTRKGGVGTDDGNSKKNKKSRGGKSKKSLHDQFPMGPNPVGSFYGGGGYLSQGDLPPLVSSSSNTSWQHDASMQGYNKPRPSSAAAAAGGGGGGNDFRHLPYPELHSNNKCGRSTAKSRPVQDEPRLPPGNVSGASLLTTESGMVLTRDQAPGIGWPHNEDLALQEVMSRHKSPINWDIVAKEMNFGRSARECHDRWTRYLKAGTRKGQWREEEDAIVLRVIATNEEHPFTQWADLAPMLPGRSGKQIRDRWVNYLNPAINHLPFSREDDLKLWAGHRELGKRWVEISVKIFNSTRSENHIKNRWYSAAFKKFIANEFGNCAYVEASPSFGSVSNDTATVTTGAAAAHLMHHQGI